MLTCVYGCNVHLASTCNRCTGTVQCFFMLPSGFEERFLEVGSLHTGEPGDRVRREDPPAVAVRPETPARSGRLHLSVRAAEGAGPSVVTVAHAQAYLSMVISD